MTELLEALNQRDTINRLMYDVHRAMLTNENESIDSIRREYTYRMRRLVDNLTNINAAFLSGQNPSYEQWKALQLDAQSARAIAEEMSTFRADLIGQLEKDIRDTFKNNYNAAVWAIDQTTPFNVDPAYNLPADHVLDLLFQEPWDGQRFSDRVWKITDDWARNIQNQLSDSILKGDSVPEMARKIRDYVGVPANERLMSRPRASAQLYRATLIARTEMIRAGRMAQDRVYTDNADIVEDKVWSAKPGLLGVCELCRERDGKTPEEILAAGLPLEEHPNGRCSWIPKLKSWSEMLDPVIQDIKDAPGKLSKDLMIQPNEFGNLKPVKIEPFQEWSIQYLTDKERAQ